MHQSKGPLIPKKGSHQLKTHTYMHTHIQYTHAHTLTYTHITHMYNMHTCMHSCTCSRTHTFTQGPEKHNACEVHGLIYSKLSFPKLTPRAQIPTAVSSLHMEKECWDQANWYNTLTKLESVPDCSGEAIQWMDPQLWKSWFAMFI